MNFRTFEYIVYFVGILYLYYTLYRGFSLIFSDRERQLAEQARILEEATKLIERIRDSERSNLVNQHMTEINARLAAEAKLMSEKASFEVEKARFEELKARFEEARAKFEEAKANFEEKIRLEEDARLVEEATKQLAENVAQAGSDTTTTPSTGAMDEFGFNFFENLRDPFFQSYTDGFKNPATANMEGNYIFS